MTSFYLQTWHKLTLLYCHKIRKFPATFPQFVGKLKKKKENFVGVYCNTITTLSVIMMNSFKIVCQRRSLHYKIDCLFYQSKMKWFFQIIYIVLLAFQKFKIFLSFWLGIFLNFWHYHNLIIAPNNLRVSEQRSWQII